MLERSSRNAPREWERNNSSNSIRLILLNEPGGHDWKLRRALLTYLTVCGRLAQLGERIVRNDEAGGSIPPPSTIIPCHRRLFGSAAILSSTLLWIIHSIRWITGLCLFPAAPPSSLSCAPPTRFHIAQLPLRSY